MAYKDSLFRSLFGNEKSALVLYNALHGTDYSERDTEVTINTLSESLFMPQKNDLSFLMSLRGAELRGILSVELYLSGGSFDRKFI